ncbi:MAG: MBL fold metallo-hydrolase [Chloroflexi bacterium]|nr:MBL fold metallo-hydrolase [Chloroflexota bacterium]MDA1148111.1 MBL fold metallo-hydrolase [Chloroflexota bacterium]
MAVGDTQIVELATGVYARLHEGLTNGGIIVGDEGVLLIDSLRVPSFARDLIADVKKLTDKPIRYVVDTHSHWDHSWGNEEFPDSTIIGHANCRAEMVDLEARAWWMNRVVSAGDPWSKEAETVRVTPPDLTFDEKMSLYFAGRRIDLLYLGRAHTSGDIFVHLPDDRLLFTGDVAQDGGVPFMLDGYPKDWVATDIRLAQIDCERFMSGHGPIGAPSALLEARDFIAAIADGTTTAIASGQDRDTTATEVTASMTDRFGHWRGFERVHDSVAYTYDQLTA